jgi:hypothetical protein
MGSGWWTTTCAWCARPRNAASRSTPMSRSRTPARGVRIRTGSRARARAAWNTPLGASRRTRRSTSSTCCSPACSRARWTTRRAS